MRTRQMEELKPLVCDQEGKTWKVDKVFEGAWESLSVLEHWYLSIGCAANGRAFLIALVMFLLFLLTRFIAVILPATSQTEAVHLEDFVGDWRHVASNVWAQQGKMQVGSISDSGELMWSEKDRLWKLFGVHSNKAKRNMVMVDVLAKLRPRRVLEWAGYGGFFVQAMLTHEMLRNQVKHWVHVELSSGALDYSVFLLQNDTLIRSERRCRSGRASGHLVNLEKFDTFVAASFGHFILDLEFLQILPPQSRFVFSVKNYGHRLGVRYFNNVQEIYNRYARYLDINEVQEVPQKWNLWKRRTKFVVSSRVRRQ
eukprot:TRINITY_DN9595_c0_g1_i2.p1 TRINITY_DN9595_c0_g1~~TRINITY_DN9595_c0_g1_i2.p1  ORF type:complete len:312 (+),score=31.71 TRINITY_DN9595_c0_g1_i2:90-1025(+)